MRLLHFVLLAPGSPNWGMRFALKNWAEADGGAYAEFDWMMYRQRDVSRLRHQFMESIKTFKPDLIFLHLQTAGVLGADDLLAAREFGAKIVSWCGDVREKTPDWAFEIAPAIDLHLFTNMRDVQNIRDAGFGADYLQIGFSELTFRPDGPVAANVPPIVFMGNNYGTRFPLSTERMEMVVRLKKKFGNQFGLYGRGWDGWWPGTRWVDEETEASIYRGCKVAICQNHFNDVPRFSSDRLWRITGSGAFCLCNRYPEAEKEFRIGWETEGWTDMIDLEQKIEDALRPNRDPARIKTAESGCKRSHREYTWRHRVAELDRLLKSHGISIGSSIESAA